MIKQGLLQQAGLNDSEVKIYRRLLEYGELTPPKLSTITGLTRQNTYAALKTLAKKDLIEPLSRRKKLTYQLKNPNNLLEMVDKQISDSKIVQKSLKANMPELLSMFSLKSGKPGITYFDGMESAKNIYLDGLRTKPQEVLVFSSIHDEQRWGDFLFSYLKRKAQNGTVTRIISSTKPTAQRSESDKQLLMQRKYIPDSIFHLDTEIAIASNQVSFITFEKVVKGFVITSDEVAQTMRTIFEALWASNFK